MRYQIAHAPTPAEVGLASELPAENLAGADRKQYFNRRRPADPLGAGHAETWRSRVIKVAAEIVVSARRIVVRLSSHWPYVSDLLNLARIALHLCSAERTDERLVACLSQL